MWFNEIHFLDRLKLHSYIIVLSSYCGISFSSEYVLDVIFGSISATAGPLGLCIPIFTHNYFQANVILWCINLEHSKHDKNN